MLPLRQVSLCAAACVRQVSQEGPPKGQQRLKQRRAFLF